MVVVTSEALTQSESHVPPVVLALLSPKFLSVYRPVDSLVCRQTAGSTFHLVSFLESLILFSVRCPVLAQDQHIHAITRMRRERIRARVQTSIQIEVLVTDSQSVF